MLIANNETRESGSFMGDALCSLKAAYLFVENEPSVDRVIMSMSPGNEMLFVWAKFIETYKVEVVWDDWNAGDWSSRWAAWDKWRAERSINGTPIDHYRELYLRIHGHLRQTLLCGHERGLGRRNIYEYWFYGQEHKPETCAGSDWYDDSLTYHPPLTPERDVYISPHCKTQGNVTFTFDYWSAVIRKLLDAGITVTVGYDGPFCEDLNGHPLYKKHWGNHEDWFKVVCRHKIVACGNTGTGWVAAACGVPLLTAEPPNSQMPDHRYRECGLRNIVEVVDTPDADYCAQRLIEECRKVLVMTTGCYDILHAGHVRHLERSRALGTRLVVALNSDASVSSLKGPTRPVNPQGQRRAVLEALRCVDEVRVFDGPDATELIKELRPTVLTAGYGYTQDKIVGRDLVEGWGGRAEVTCNMDATNQPSTTKIVRKLASVHAGNLADICRLGSCYSVNPVEKIALMAEEFLKVADLPGDVADLGTYLGGTALVLRRLAPERHLHLFDTWEGNPYDDELCHHKKGEWKADLAGCKEVVGQGDKTYYHPGVFPYSQHNVDDDSDFCFVYVDMDTYQATKDAIRFFWPRLVSGGKLVLDDYNWPACAGVKKAVDEALKSDEVKTSSIRVSETTYTFVATKR